MPKATFTARWVANIRAPERGQLDYFDNKPPNLGLRVSYGGKKSWFVMYRYQGRLRRLMLGIYPHLSLADARSKANTVRYAVAQGEDPATEKQTLRQAPTVAEVVEQFMNLYSKPHKKSWREDHAIFQKEILPEWGSRKFTNITRRDVIMLLDRLIERGVPAQANRIRGLVSKLYNWGLDRDLVDSNPCWRVTAPAPSHQRDRVLSEHEIRIVWKACTEMDIQYRSLFRLQLLSAQRMGELRTMRWQDLDLEAGWWTIPGNMVKNSLSHRVPLTPQVKEIINVVLAFKDNSSWVFPSPRRPGETLSRYTMQSAVVRLRKQTDLDFVIHDLRRTAASHMASMGISRLLIGKILNHVEPGVTRVYDRHSYDAEKRDALEKWGRKLMSIVGEGELAKVISMRH